MRALTATVTANEPIVGRLAQLSLSAAPLGAALAGQWVALRRPDALTIAAQPFPLAAMDAGAGTADLLYGSHDRLAPWLATLAPGDALDVLGPWGRAWPIDARTRHALVLGSDTALIGLLALARTLVDAGAAVVVLHDAPTATLLLPPILLPPAVELHVATADGSAGAQGSALDLLPPLLSWADALYAALSPPLYLPLRDMVQRGRLRVRRGFATVLATAPLACYAAACDGCAVPLRHGGYGLLCKDGPAFDLLDL